MSFSSSLPLSKDKIARCRAIAKDIGGEVAKLVHENSTVGIERAILRLLGFNSAFQQDDLLYPSSNAIVDQLEENGRLTEGALYWVANAVLQTGKSIESLESELVSGKFHFGTVATAPEEKVRKLAQKLANDTLGRLNKMISARKKIKSSLKDPMKENRPLKYVIVATGNIFEDVLQAKAAVLDGADIIAVIRSTAQSLLDYVPQGTTTVGFGGTYATQGNFKVMREALDEIGKKVGRYIRLTNYASGLCMSEIALLASFEGLDCLLNDAMYGILFRDINVIRTLVDQHFSRLLCARSGIWIMTGEDNYLKTTDAAKTGHTVLASEFINERTALNANMSPAQMCLGHAMEMDPQKAQVILLELSRAKMTRQIFPESPLKYMCNTKYKSGDIFTSHAIDTIFNLIGTMTDQGVLLLGMLTEAVHTPFLHDRSLSIRSGNYIVSGAAGLGSELGYRSDGKISKYAEEVLDNTLQFLQKIKKTGFVKSIEKGEFADVKRAVTGGKGKSGVFRIDSKKYFNPFYKLLGSKI